MTVGPSPGRRPVFPFSAIVGQDDLKLALRLCAISPTLGGVLIRGQKGTAKSTAVRALAAVLPEIRAVAGCRYACDPDAPDRLCQECVDRLAAGGTLVGVTRRVALVELPVGATDDRVVGTLDLERAIQSGERAFEPGLLARANRGLLYADEVNLLADHLVDVLLDAAAMGVNFVEREGVSVSHPAEFILVGTMNPEEGELRPQLLDRFALCVDAGGALSVAERGEVVRRRIAFERDPAAFAARWAAVEAAEAARIAAARARLPRVRLPDPLLTLIGEICAAFGVDGLRADLVTYKAACALAAWEGRADVTADDIRVAAELALHHRRRRQPFDDPGLDRDRLDELIREHAPPAPDDHPADDPDHGTDAGDVGEDADDGENPTGVTPPDDGKGPGDGAGGSSPGDPPGGAGGPPADRVFETPDAYPIRPPDEQRRKWWLGPSGRRAARVADPKRGQPVGAALWQPGRPVAWSATFRAAAPSQMRRREPPPRPSPEGEGDGSAGAAVWSPPANPPSLPPRKGRGTDLPAVRLALAAEERGRAGEVPPAAPALLLRRDDLRSARLAARAGQLVLIAVDASGSMGARARMTAAKGAAVSLLLDAYQKRDRVALVAFRGRRAELVLPPTGSVELAERRLRDLPTGGRTPLLDALAVAGDALARAARAGDRAAPFVVVISDGRGNVFPDGVDPDAALEHLAARLRALAAGALVVDVEHGATRLGLARRLADRLGARWLPVEHLAAAPLRAAIDAARGG